MNSIVLVIIRLDTIFLCVLLNRIISSHHQREFILCCGVIGSPEASSSKFGFFSKYSRAQGYRLNAKPSSLLPLLVRQHVIPFALSPAITPSSKPTFIEFFFPLMNGFRYPCSYGVNFCRDSCFDLSAFF